MKATIHVHQAKMRKAEPAIIVRTYKGSTHHRKVVIKGPSYVYQSPTPDKCGARVWIHANYEDLVLDAVPVVDRE